MFFCVHDRETMQVGSFTPLLIDWCLSFACSYRLITIFGHQAVNYLKEVFTLLVNAHVGRTQKV